MSDNIPFEIQMEIIKKVSDVNSLIQFRFIYWGACELTFDVESILNHMVVTFDLITKEFKVVDLPDSLTKELWSCCSVSKLRGSLVVSGYIKVEGALCCGVWVMEHDSSFRKLFTIRALVLLAGGRLDGTLGMAMDWRGFMAVKQILR
ncbi:hypothetical protein Tco_0180189 [Tanacetum coccineum]